MSDLLGPLEKTLIGAALLLLAVYYVLAQAFPEWSAPELRLAGRDLPESVDEQPRKGRVVPSPDLQDYMARQEAELTVDEFRRWPPPRGAAAGPAVPEINILAAGVDGQMHPANAYLKGFVPFATDKYWVPLAAVSLRVRYLRDDPGFLGKYADVWQTSPYTYKNMWGDCEDFAILLADWMIGLGYDARVVVGKVKGEGHAWVVMERGGEEYLLEATERGSRRSFPLTRLHPEYEPECMFDRDSFWVRRQRSPYSFSGPEVPWFRIAQFVAERPAE